MYLAISLVFGALAVAFVVVITYFRECRVRPELWQRIQVEAVIAEKSIQSVRDHISELHSNNKNSGHWQEEKIKLNPTLQNRNASEERESQPSVLNSPENQANISSDQQPKPNVSNNQQAQLNVSNTPQSKPSVSNTSESQPNYPSYQQRPLNVLDIQQRQLAALNTAQRQSSVSNTPQIPAAKNEFAHLFLVSTLKGHTGNILGIDVSPNGNFMASCADDRTVNIWFTEDFAKMDHRTVPINIAFDYAASIKWSPSSTEFIITRKQEKMLEGFQWIYSPHSLRGQVIANRKWIRPTSELKGFGFIGAGIACDGKLILTCLENGTVEFRERSGIIVKIFQSAQLEVVDFKVSPCGRFMAIAGLDEIEIYEVSIETSGSDYVPKIHFFRKWYITKVGYPHDSTISSFAFSSTAWKLAVVKQDGRWLLYDLNRYHLTLKSKRRGKVYYVTRNPIASISDDASVVAIGSNRSLFLFSGASGKLIFRIKDIYSGVLSCVGFSWDQKYIITAGDNLIHVFVNIKQPKEKPVDTGSTKSGKEGKQRCGNQFGKKPQSLEGSRKKKRSLDHSIVNTRNM